MSLTDNLDDADRLTSTVAVSWVGDDPDGFVESFEFRFYDENIVPAAEEDWVLTTRNDTLVLLPIQSGSKSANVAFEVRAIDNEGVRDPSPARTVFPIQNSPPTIQLSSFDLPPDTTFPLFSFSWRAGDPDGIENLSRIEISLNDSLNFISLPVDLDFVTLQVPDLGRNTPGGSVAADVFLGRGYSPSDIDVPGLLVDSDNTLFIRSVDDTDTTSFLASYEWFIKRSSSRVLYVNDFRKVANVRLQAFHLGILESYLPAGTEIDTWNITEPFVTGNSGNVPRSDALPPNADPTLRQYFGQYDYIYWVSSGSTNSIGGNNFPLAASVLDVFFDNGGKIMVHTPITAPIDPELNEQNPAIAILPLNQVVFPPDSLRRLSISIDAVITPIGTLPNITDPLPELVARQFIIGALPFEANTVSSAPIYTADYRYLTLQNASGPWPGPSFVASISTDQRVGLFTLPMINEQSGTPILTDVDGDPEAARELIRLMLESLGFPKQ